MSDLDQDTIREFVTVKSLKSYLKSSDNQDDEIYSWIVKVANNELIMNLSPLIDDVTSIKDKVILIKASDVALTFCLSRIRGNSQDMYEESSRLLNRYCDELNDLLKYVKFTTSKES